MSTFRKAIFIGLVLVILAFVVLPALIVATVQAATNPQETAPTVSSFLLWLTTGGAVIAVSWVAERSAWFQALTSDKKKYIQYGASAVLGIAALLIQTYMPAETIELLNPYFRVIVSVFGMVFLNQIAHTNDPVAIENRR